MGPNRPSELLQSTRRVSKRPHDESDSFCLVYTGFLMTDTFRYNAFACIIIIKCLCILEHQVARRTRFYIDLNDEQDTF